MPEALRITQGSPLALSACDSFADKALAYGMPGLDVDGNDVLACHEAMSRAVERARSGGGPSLLVLKTYRMLGHSSSDDPTKYRDPREVERWAARDPLDRYEAFLIERGVIASGERDRIEAELLDELDRVIHEQEAAPPMALKTLVEDVYAEVPRHLRGQYNEFIKVAQRHGEAQPGDGAFPL